MRKENFARAIFILLSVLMVASCEVDNGTRVNRVDLSLQPGAKSFKIAVLVDPHIDSVAALKNLDRIVTAVLETDPDFIVLLFLRAWSIQCFAPTFKRPSVLP